ncbi:DNA primase [Chryseobacterium sp. MEBOG07]|uniref:DNA primase n=1 Tax=Chryseobacterium sp. MEBOG07 TaxID=2879939 RepID=UPI001F027C79|nr:DNA primase [Chryseobacterium sp. MEBOG07]UKB81241.1 DNA primase [Chryseobacterium sp. MEBOG07]
MSKISQQTIDEIKDTPLSQALNGFIKLKPSGSVLKGISPFNIDEKTPSFMVSDSKGIWKCYSSGKGGKDLIKFLMETEALDYLSAVIKAAKELQINIRYDQETSEEKERREKKEILQDIVTKANESYINNFKRLPADHWVKKYMIEVRGFTPEILDLFDIGYSFNDSHLTKIIKSQGLLSDALELGLVKKDKVNETQHYDFFRDRVMFPIINHKTYCIGFTARINPEKSDEVKQKYLNSSDSIIFNKSTALYGYNLAKAKIKFFGYALLVEGPTDVMRMHQVGFDNAVGTLGTALTVDQINLLKKVTDKVVIFRDNDKNGAGQKAAIRDMELLLKNGMLAEIIVPEHEGDDPDSIGKKMGDDSLSYLSALQEDSVMYLLKNKYQELMAPAIQERDEEIKKHKKETGKDLKPKKLIMSPASKKAFVEFTGKVISYVSDSLVKNQYIKIVVDRFKDDISTKEINDILKDIEEESKPKTKVYMNLDWEYELPKDLLDAGCKTEDFIEDIQRYGLFMAKNRIWHIMGDEAPYNFKHVSNFSFEIIQHMSGETSKKLFRMTNVFGKDVIAHAESNLFNSVIGFKNIVTDKGGNFQYKASNQQHENILSFLYDKMGDGLMIEQLGWIPSAKFWVWNNEIILPKEGKVIPMQENGVYVYNKVSYYFPSANKVYKDIPGKYVPQKKFLSIDSRLDFYSLMAKIVKVHKQRGMTAILFGISALFQDIVEHHTKSFPIYFLYGEGGSGKDNIAEIIQSFVGEPQSVINLAAKSSTLTSQIRKISQFNNGIVHFSEYRRGLNLDELIKQYFDRRGREIGTTESKFSTDEIPMTSAVVITGNEYSEDSPTMSRQLFEEISVSKHTEEETDAYNDLKEMVIEGFSKYSNQFILDRERFEKSFLKEYNMNKRHLSSLPDLKDTMSRMIQNLSVLYTTYTLYCDTINFPFTKLELENHFAKIVKNMKNKMAGASPISRFWECFMASMRGNSSEVIMLHKDYKVEGNLIFIKFTQVYNTVLSRWLRTYKETIPAKSEMLEMLKNDSSFYNYKDKCRISNNAKVGPTSAFIFDLNKMIYVKDDILSLYELQKNHGSLFQETIPEDETVKFAAEND